MTTMSTSDPNGIEPSHLSANESERGARRADARLRALLRNVSDTITVLDAQGTVRFLGGNPQGTLGYPDEWLEGRSAFELLHLTTSTRPSSWVPGAQVSRERGAG